MRILLLALVLLPAACDVDSGTKPSAKEPAAVEDARILRAQLEMRTLAAELEQYHAVNGRWPADWAALRRSGKDPWGNDYVYGVDDGKVLLFSGGPDGDLPTDDDLAGP